MLRLVHLSDIHFGQEKDGGWQNVRVMFVLCAARPVADMIPLSSPSKLAVSQPLAGWRQISPQSGSRRTLILYRRSRCDREIRSKIGRLQKVCFPMA